MKKIKKIFNKFINLNLSLKLRILLIFFIVFLLTFSVISYIFTYSDLVIDFTTDTNYKASGIYNNIVLVNDLENDLYYYKGLNYTDNDGTLPTTINKNIYNDSNLVQVKITYLGKNELNNRNSKVSLTENQDEYIYFKAYPVNDNGTSDPSDDYIDIELIDSPFINRDDDVAFNNWITSYEGVTISYDNKYHLRYAKVPVTYAGTKPNKIDITFYSSYVYANTSYMNGNTSWANAFSSLDQVGMKKIEAVEFVYGTVDMAGYFHSVSIGWYQPCSGYYNQNGVYQNNCTCTSFRGCTYYDLIEEENFSDTETYYELKNGYMQRVDNSSIEIPIIDYTVDELYDTSNMAGFYKTKDFTRGDDINGYYSSNGSLLSGTCGSNSCTYYELLQYYDENNQPNLFSVDNDYYYLVTRDTNIIVLNGDVTGGWASGQNKPFTLTGINNGTDYNASWTVSSAINCYNDTTIENLEIYYDRMIYDIYTPTSATAGGVLLGRYNNVKIGRGITQNGNYPNFRALIAGYNTGTGSNGSPTSYRFQVESGIYNSISLTNIASLYRNPNLYIKNKSVYGSDYDRVSGNNSLLDVYYCASGSWSGYIYGSTSTTTANEIALDLIVKSGTFGSSEHDLSTGIYVGGRYGGTHYAARQIKVEGGHVYNINGGPLTASGRSGVNDTYIYMTGGDVDVIIGGAGTTATYGNRIIQVTGGTVNYSVFGGSNGAEGSEGDGTLNGTPYVYIGGTATIGNASYVENNNTIHGSEAGSVFGIGNGRSGYSTIGSADNSIIIIDEKATVKRNVYGGGNFGATGVSSQNNTSYSKIFIHDGLVEGSVYGGGNNNGSGSTSKTSTIEINMDGGNVLGSIYGGANEEGTIYGSINVTVIGGEITNSVYGGGRGGYINGNNPGTFVRDDILVTIGSNDSDKVPIINQAVYGGSAYGSVNGTTQTTNLSSSNTNVIVNKGLITNVFGGGQGNDTYVPYVEGDIKVQINGGTITNVYGGNDANGKPNGNIEVYINNGTITNTFGGGNQTSANTTNVYLTGGFSDNIYGGSNLTGEVTTSNVITTGGTSINVYGGNNQGGTTDVTNVTINGGNITNVYGGGEQTSVTTNTNVNLNSYATNVFGGSNLNGTIPISNIIVTNGGALNVYGGNNQGGTTTTSNIDVNGSNITNLYGGGLKASTTTSNIDAYYGYITNLYGGGSEAGVDTTNVRLGNALVENVFGGSNILGDVTTSQISNLTNTTNNDIEITTSYTLSYQNQSGATGITSSEQIDVSILNKTGVTLTTWDLYLYTSDGLFDSNWSDANVSGSHGIYHIDEIDQYYGTNPLSSGSSYSFNFNVHAYVPLEDYKIYNYVFIGYDASGNKYFKTLQDDLRVYNLYGGNNQGGTTITTNLTMTSGLIDVIYGGGNKAITTTTNVNIQNALVNEAIYGGGNEASVTTVNLNLDKVTVGNDETEGSVYGGGNKAAILDTVTAKVLNNTTIKGNLYAGGNLGAINGTVNLSVSDSSITNSIYGGGNKASVGNSTSDVVTTLKITNTTSEDIYGGGRSAGINGSTNVTVSSSNISGSIYGGGNGLESVVTGDTNGEQNPAKVIGNTNLLVDNNTTVGNSIYGGGNLGFVNQNTNVIIKEATIEDSVYGGGNAAKVLQNTNLKLTNPTVKKSVYAGGNGTTANVVGNTNLNIEGTTTVLKHVFGGGNAAPTGTSEVNNSNSLVNIAGANISGNVYGGANTSVLYGITTLNIGSNVVTDNTLIKGDITIGGTVFGGGEANEEGSEVIDFSFISVTKGITINIDGLNHNTFTIKGSIFGSGNASMTQGYSNVYISNYGTATNIQKNISLQRADMFSISNSHIILSGATDRTNEFSDVLFTLSRIDELKLKNNSSLYLDTGANLVKKFSSLVDIDGSEVKASVEIDDETKTVTKNVNNRLYMLEGKNFNIARNQAVTLYGDVSGMTFFGMYLRDQNKNPITALYDAKYDYGDTPASGDLYYFTSGSYVLGSHMTNHNIEVDGFYSNFANEENTSLLDVKYIEPTPADSDFYMWVIGEQVISYDVHLTASKYSTLGIEEFSFLNFSNANTKFSILGFNYANLADGVSLVPSSDIPRIAENPSDADNVMGLAIKTGPTGWITVGETEFVSNETNPILGTTTYESENTNAIRSFVFYLYHSKNLQSAGQMGSVTISLVAITPIDELTNEVERINFNVEISRALFTTDEYEASMTPGKQYKMFASSPVNITNDSSFSAYYSLYMEKDTNPYKEGYHRVLTSSYVLPVNTKITMIDYVNPSLPVYYYYVVNQTDYEASLQEYHIHNEVSYELSKFIKMGSVTSTNNYDDASANNSYYDADTKKAEEEFIFIVDFKESNIQEDITDKRLLLELRNQGNQTLISVLGIQQETMTYNLYYDKHAVIDLTSDIDTLEFYNGNDLNLNLSTNFIQQTIGSNTIYDTNYYDLKLGLKISIYDENNNLLTGSSLMGISYTYNDITYYPRYDGTTRINIAPRVANVSTKIKVNAKNSNLAGGNYKIVIESFGSPDGIYYGLESSDTLNLNLHVMDTLYGLKMTINEKAFFIDKTTGKNLLDSSTLNLNVKYESGLENPNLRIKLYRRLYDSIYSTSYEEVDLANYFSNNLVKTNENEYYLDKNPVSEVNYFLYQKDNLKSGTYKLEILLYDKDTYVGSVYQYLIIK